MHVLRTTDCVLHSPSHAAGVPQTSAQQYATLKQCADAIQADPTDGYLRLLSHIAVASPMQEYRSEPGPQPVGGDGKQSWAQGSGPQTTNYTTPNTAIGVGAFLMWVLIGVAHDIL